jgi:hypothetical protein
MNTGHVEKFRGDQSSVRRSSLDTAVANLAVEADMIEDEFGHIDYDESGDGPTVVLVPGYCGSAALSGIAPQILNDK